jgi:2-hydroxychromene-2-carboxylate isomerase
MLSRLHCSSFGMRWSGRAIEANEEHYEAVIAGNEAAQKSAGHWGVPLMVFEGEPFFGQDRFETLKWRMVQKGLKRRT